MKLHRWLLRLTLCVFISLDVQASCVVLSWTATGDDGSIGRAAEYDIRYSTRYITDANWDSAIRVSHPPVPKQAGAMEFVRVPDLEPGVRYYFAMKVADEKPNWSAMSNVVSRTAPDDCVGTVGNVDCDPNEHISLMDLVVLIDHLYVTFQPLCCPGEGHIDGRQDDPITLYDLMLLIQYLFDLSGTMPSCS